MGWKETQKELLDGGFTPEEVAQEEQKRRLKLQESGDFSPAEVDRYFGVKQFDDNAANGYWKKTLDDLHEAGAFNAPDKRAKIAETILDSFQAGMQGSVSGLLKRQKNPDIFVPEDATWGNRMASMAGQFVGDLPAMAVGGAAGVETGPGALATAFAFPEGMRKVMMDRYEKGEAQSFGEFWNRMTDALVHTAKSYVTGLATGIVGGKVGQAVGGKALNALGEEIVARPFLSNTAQLASEAMTMTTVGKALEGHMPEPKDFADAAVFMLGMKGLHHGSQTLRNVFVKTGIGPKDVALAAQENPALKEQVMSANPDMEKISMELTGQSLLGERGSVSAKSTKPVEPARTDAQKAILDKISVNVPEKSKLKSFDELYTDYVDKKNPIKLSQEQMQSDVLSPTYKDPTKLPVLEDGYKLSRLADDYKAKALHFIQNATLDYNTLAKKGPGLEQILEPVANDKKLFDGILAAKRAVGLHETIDKQLAQETDPVKIKQLQKKQSGLGFDVDQAREMLKTATPEQLKAADQYTKWRNEVTDYAVSAGLVSRLDKIAWEAMDKNYVDFARVMLPEEGATGQPGKFSSFKKLGGVGEDVKTQSPLLSGIDSAQKIIKMSEQNRAIRALVEMQKNSDTKVMEPVEMKTTVTKADVEELQKYFDDHGIKAEATEPLALFRKEQSYVPRADEFTYWEDGKLKVMKAKDPALATAIKGVSGDFTSQSLIMKMASGATALKKLGITLTPDFILRNVIRDRVTSEVYSKDPTSVKEVLQAVGSLIKKDEHYWNFLKSGGAQGAFIDLARNPLRQEMMSLYKETGTLEALRNTVNNVKDLLNVPGHILEQAPRLAEHKKVSKGASSGPDLFEGGFADREVTLDFQRMGAKISALNAITAFQNVAIQGLDRSARAFKEDPTRFAKAGLKYITTASALLWFVNHDEDWYKEIPRWEKDLYWHIQVPFKVPGLTSSSPKGEIILRIPKPQEVGPIFGSLPERLLDLTIGKNPRAMKDFGETMQRIIMPSFIPDIAAPVAEQAAEKSFFTGAPLIPWGAEKRMPPDQYFPYTSETAKLIGKAMGNFPSVSELGPDGGKLGSPAVIDNYIQSWSGTLGKYITQLSDAALRKAHVVKDVPRPDWTVNDIPFAKAFFSRYPNMNSQSIIDFKARVKELDKVAGSIEFRQKQMDVPGAMQLQREYGPALSIAVQARKSVSEIEQNIRSWNADPNMSSHGKRQLINKGTYDLVQIAQRGLQKLDEVDRIMKGKTK